MTDIDFLERVIRAFDLRKNFPEDKVKIEVVKGDIEIRVAGTVYTAKTLSETIKQIRDNYSELMIGIFLQNDGFLPK